MISDEIRQKLQNIVRGERQEGPTDACTAVRNLLCESFGASPTVKSEFESKAIIKEKQVGFIKSYAGKEGFWLESMPPGFQYLTEGGESKIYLSEDGRHVIKVNDAGYFQTQHIHYWDLPRSMANFLSLSGNFLYKVIRHR
jgi:hypothetical protein